MATVAVVASMSLQSCDDDSDIVYTLEGTWEGQMNVFYEYGGTDYESTYSEICFNSDPYTYSSGTGYWVDYYSTDIWGYNYVANHITWTVSGGVIYVNFVEEGSQLEIRDYRLNDNRFEGTIYMDGVTTDFSLIHTSSPNWDSFYYYDYYAKPGNKPAGVAPKRTIGVTKD